MSTDTITIKDFYKGTASSPYVSDGAVAKSVNLDIFNYPGVARGSWHLKSQSSLPTALPLWTTQDPNTGNIFILDNAGKITVSADFGVTWASLTYAPSSFGQGNGMACWKGYLFVARGTVLDVMQVSTGTWTYAWQTFNASNQAWNHHPIIASRNAPAYLYIGDLNQMSFVQEVTGQTFDPTNGATYSWEALALQLPDHYFVNCLEELQDKIIIGTKSLQTSVIGGGEVLSRTAAVIFSWDGISTKYDNATSIDESQILSMRNIGDIIYVFAGVQGKLYYYQESGLVPLGRIPFKYNTQNQIMIYPDAMTCKSGRMFVGVSYNNVTDSSLVTGVYSFDITTQKFAVEHLISTGTEQGAIIGTLFTSAQDALIVGQENGIGAATYSIDALETGIYYSAYTSYFETLLYQVGSTLTPGNYSQIEIHLSKQMVTGNGLRIRLRQNSSTPWDISGGSDIIAIITPDKYPGSSFTAPCRVSGVQQLQLRVEFLGSTELIEMSLIPSI